MSRQRLGTDSLLDLLVRGPRHDHQGPRLDQSFAHAVVAAHAHDGVGGRHELRIVGPRHHATRGCGLRLQPCLLVSRHERPRHQDRVQTGEPCFQPLHGGPSGLQHRIAVVAAAYGCQHHRSVVRQSMSLTQRPCIKGGRIADDVAAVVKLGLDRRRDGVGCRHVVEFG